MHTRPSDALHIYFILFLRVNRGDVNVLPRLKTGATKPTVVIILQLLPIIVKRE